MSSELSEKAHRLALELAGLRKPFSGALLPERLAGELAREIDDLIEHHEAELGQMTAERDRWRDRMLTLERRNLDAVDALLGRKPL